MPLRPRVSLIAALLAVSSSAAADPAAEYVGSFHWGSSNEAFFGFSGIEVTDDGRQFFIIGDSSQLIQGSFGRDDSGKIRSVSVTSVGSLRASDGSSIRGTPFEDSEGLAALPDGSFAVSFEGKHRVNLYAAIDGPATPLPRPREFAAFVHNSALEALAADDRGTLYAVPEKAGGLVKDFPVFRYRDGSWDVPFGIPRNGSYLPVGADFGPDGRFYLLERQFLGVLGFSSRVRRFAISGDTIGEGEVLLRTPARRHDNLEGLSVWRDDMGDIRLTMVSDDNNLPIQRTEIVEYRLIE